MRIDLGWELWCDESEDFLKAVRESVVASLTSSRSEFTVTEVHQHREGTVQNYGTVHFRFLPQGVRDSTQASAEIGFWWPNEMEKRVRQQEHCEIAPTLFVHTREGLERCYGRLKGEFKRIDPLLKERLDGWAYSMEISLERLGGTTPSELFQMIESFVLCLTRVA